MLIGTNYVARGAQCNDEVRTKTCTFAIPQYLPSTNNINKKAFLSNAKHPPFWQYKLHNEQVWKVPVQQGPNSTSLNMSIGGGGGTGACTAESLRVDKMTDRCIDTTNNITFANRLAAGKYGAKKLDWWLLRDNKRLSRKVTVYLLKCYFWDLSYFSQVTETKIPTLKQLYKYVCVIL